MTQEASLTISPLRLPHLLNVAGVRTAAENMARRFEGTVERAATPLTTSLLGFARLAGSAYFVNRKLRRAVAQDPSLPEPVRRDPPSLRSAIWLVMVDNALTDKRDEKKLEPTEKYPWALYTLMRDYLNGLDDIMDGNRPPVNKKMLSNNDTFAQIQQAFAKEFLTIYRAGHKDSAKRSLQFFRVLRDIWIEKINQYENKYLSFDEAVIYTIETMGPLTESILYVANVKKDIPIEKESAVAEALIWYAAAGKIIDDVTDWYKDWRRSQPNMFQLAMKETGELERVIAIAGKFPKLNEQTYIPVSLLKLIAPKAVEKVTQKIDLFIDELSKYPFPMFEASMRFARNNMWAYALNESIPQV